MSPIEEEKFQYWKAEAEKIWFEKEYNHLAWFVGINYEIPRGIGYEIGRRLIANYLSTHPDKKASELYAAEANMFLPNN